MPTHIIYIFNNNYKKGKDGLIRYINNINSILKLKIY